ncbi:pathogenesis-related protein 1 [Acrasis kona]|uniref:Pathogenesis-related protein 1 n=1 Tax=Acrasis kona TaxID=1008807 RepID=A0AAW2YVE3_9EUKA
MQSALIFALLVLVATAMAQGVVQDFTQDEINSILSAHNYARSSVGVSGVTWSATTAQFAKNYAVKCLSSNKVLMDHNPNRNNNGVYLGENIYAFTGDKASGFDASMNWIQESRDYNYSTNTCAPNKICGHYTQVVWRSSTKIGCARVKCSNIQYGATVLCNYEPGGNYNGQKPY